MTCLVIRRSGVRAFACGLFCAVALLFQTPGAWAGIQPSKKNANWIVIPKAELGSEQLLRGSLISLVDQSGAPTSSGLQSRIVTFQRKSGSVFMLESNEGHVVTDSLPAHLILAELPVVSETKTTLTVDFNAGMKHAYLARNWHASDHDGRSYVAWQRALANDSIVRFVEKAKTVGDSLVIEQVLQIKQDLGVLGVYPSLTARYYLSPYRPSADFVARENSGFRNFGFFETPPYLEKGTGRSTVRVSRWKLPKNGEKITYFVSANTPKEYVEAVREGILYWNKAFGREVLEARVAPVGITAPDLEHNLVQWVEWDKAGMAYADALMDPRTGETLNAQVYMTSMWAFNSKRNAISRLRELEERVAQQAIDSPAELAGQKIPHGQPGHRCKITDRDALRMMQQAVDALSGSDATDEAALRISQDIVRSTVAHEVGHTLGLRHNFMGQTDLNVSFSERDKHFLKYLTSGELPKKNLVLSSSVMDYLVFENDALVGAQIKRGEKALTYDEMAIRWAYAESEKDQPRFKSNKTPPFGTDTDVGAYEDVARYSPGPHPLLNNVYQMQAMLMRMPSVVLDRYFDAMGKRDARDRKSIEEVKLNPELDVLRLISLYRSQLRWLDAQTQSRSINLLVEKQLGQVIGQPRLEMQLQWVQAQVQEIGGVENAFFYPFAIAKDTAKAFERFKTQDGFADVASHEIAERLNSISGFKGEDGKWIRLTPAQKKEIFKRARIHFLQVEDGIIGLALAALTQVNVSLEHQATQGRPTSDGLSAQFQKHLRGVADAVLFTPSGATIAATHELAPGVAPTVQVPNWEYSFEERKLAVKILEQSRGESLAWSMEARKALGLKLKEKIAGLGKDPLKVEAEKLAQPLREWFLENRDLLREFAKSEGCADLLKAPAPAKEEEKK